MQAESKTKTEERCLRQTSLSCKGKYSPCHFPGMTWKVVQRAPEDASPNRAPVVARIWLFPQAYFSIQLQVWNGRRGTHLIKSRCTLSISSLALMFVAFVWLETFSKFPTLCMARVVFVSPWLGSKHRALALLPRRRGEWFRLQGERERRRAGHRHTPSPRRGRGDGSRPLPPPGGAAAGAGAPSTSV